MPEKENEINFPQFIENLPEVVFRLDRNGTIRYINARVEQTLGYKNKELIGKRPLVVVSPEEHHRIEPIFQRLKNGEKYVRGEIMVVTKEGKKFPANVSINPILNDGELVAISGILIDISKEKTIEEKLVKSEERLQRLSDMALEGIVIFNEDKIIDANNAFARIFGYRINEIIGMDLKNLISPADKSSFLSSEDDGTTVPLEIKAIKKNGETFEIEFIMRSLVQEDKTVFTAVVQDISHKRQIEYMEDHDDLTNLFNRRGLLKRLKEEVEIADEIGTKLAIITIQLEYDELSIIKDIKPELLTVLFNLIPLETAERLSHSLFETDCISRVDKNEFITLHPLPGDHDIPNTVTLINKILNCFSKPFLEGVKMIPHLGVSFYPDDLKTINPNQIISNTSYACGEAIKKNKEYVFYDENSHQEMRERIEFINDLVVAVREDRCQNFNLMYQPKVNRNGKIVGMEALIRWSNSRWSSNNDNCVLPGLFIQTAEEIGLIGDIGNWVLMEACRQTKSWHQKDEKFKHLQVAVNVSPSQLNSEFEDFVDIVLNETGLSPEFLELEITEREMAKKKNLEILFRIKSKGVSIAIDDFGIDYSALNKLPKLAVDTIKLDKSYIDNVASDSDYENLVFHTIRMVHGFDFKVVAEGVEDEEQMNKLFHEMDCDKIQGFYYYKPLSVKEFEETIIRNMEET